MRSKFLVASLLGISLILNGFVFAGGGGSGGGGTSSAFNITSSYADVYTQSSTGCRDLGQMRRIIAARAATVANRAARYIAADVQLWTSGQFRVRPPKLEERTGPLSSISTPDVTYSVSCYDILNFNYSIEAKGWHKAIAQSNDPNPGSGNITRTTSDRTTL